MKLTKKTKRIIAAAGGTLAAATAVIALMVSLAQPDEPTLYMEGAEINRMEDGTVQMIVTVSLDNIRASGGAVLMLEANSEYITPSDFDTNEPVDDYDPDGADRIYRVHKDIYDRDSDPDFNKDEDLYYPFYPFGTGPFGDGSATYANEVGVSVIPLDSGNMQIQAVIEPTNAAGDAETAPRPEKGNNVWSFDASTGHGKNIRQKYIQADGDKPTGLVQFSFQVKKDKLSEMIQTFDGTSDEERGGYINENDDFLLRIDLEGDTDDDDDELSFVNCILPYWEFWDKDFVYGRPYFYVPEGTKYAESYDPYKTIVRWQFGDMLIEAESAEKDVTINAYEAYGNGTPLDLADALLRYSPTVRGTHAKDSSLEDFTLFWGGVDGCDIEIVEGDNAGDKYHLTRTYGADGMPDGGYTLQHWDKVGEKWEATNSDWYSPKGGKYTISQLFRYNLGLGEQVYPDPIVVNLTVTPITVTDVTAMDRTKTYHQSDAPDKAPDKYDDLGLPGAAQIVTDIVPGQVSLTMPIDTWTSTNAPRAKITDPLTGNLQGEAGVVWNAEGEYQFYAVPPYYDWEDENKQPTFDEPAICRFYPWLTVNKSYPLKAERRIVKDGTPLPEFEIYYGVTEDYSGLLTLKVAKKVDSAYTDMLPEDTFRLMLPSGAIVANDFAAGTDGVYRWEIQTTGDPDIENKIGYNIYLKAGTAETLGDKEAAHDLVRRSINLGGYFHVAVTEPGESESEFVNRYVAPRKNVYKYSYINAPAPDADPGTDAEGTYFDFTGRKASLYPFYLDSDLPSYVMLPAGYHVTTRYDGNTGAEPGRLTSFAVDQWEHVTPTNGTGNGTVSPWTPSGSAAMTIAYGYDGKSTYDPFAGRYHYSGFGWVENRSGDDAYNVRMDVQVINEKTPEPDPEEIESVRLTYEGQGDAVTTTATGEAKRIIFDTQKVGYTYRQNVTLTLTNNGTTTIDDIYIDVTGEAAHANEFIITQQPAPSLPPKASTTFTVSYVWDLEVDTHTAITNLPILIYSSNHTTPADSLKTFEAEFTVTDEEIYHLYVITDPMDGSWGTAGPVVGPNPTLPTLDGTPVSNTFAAETVFWVLAQPKATYSVTEIYYMDGPDKVPLRQYRSPGITTSNVEDALVTHTMPAHDMVIYVVFEESIYSRLRLIDLQGWSGAAEDGENFTHQLPLMLHEGDDDNVTSAEDVSYTKIRVEEDYESYDVAVARKPRKLLDPDAVVKLTEDEYLVVIGAEEEWDWSQVRLVLRNEDEVGFIPNIQVSVGDFIYYTYPERGVGAQPTYTTDHTSTAFTSPDPGKQKRAVITLSYTMYYLDAVSGQEISREIEREYTLIIARRFRFDDDNPIDSYPLNPGNSPYGMIMWDETIEDKDKAKKAYDENDRFAEGYTPIAAKELDLTYWQQAWTGLENYDRVDEALFVFAGQAFEDFGPVDGKVTNSAGDVIENNKITRTLTGLRSLDGNIGIQKDQFDVAKNISEVWDLGMADDPNVAGTIWGSYKIRPGIYRLQYSYTDYDDKTMVFYRPLIVLNPLGDLDQSRAAEDKDAEMLENRMTSPLGYEAVGSNTDPYHEAPLYRGRVCDANNDRNINQIDANTIYGGKVRSFYLPTGYGGKK